MSRGDQARIAMNEATFRRVNEALEHGQPDRDPLQLLCECGRLGCNIPIELSRAAYERLRESARRFAVVPGHELPDAERVVARHGGYYVVEKHGEAAAVAEATNPRAPLDELDL